MTAPATFLGYLDTKLSKWEGSGPVTVAMFTIRDHGYDDPVSLERWELEERIHNMTRSGYDCAVECVALAQWPENSRDRSTPPPLRRTWVA